MWLLLAIISGLQACEINCDDSCSLLNAPQSCYDNCGCGTLAQQYPVSFLAKLEYRHYFDELLEDTECSIKEIEECYANIDPTLFLNCIQDKDCLTAFNFPSLFNNIPFHLWRAVQPEFLINTIQVGSEKYDAYKTCQDQCHGNTKALSENLMETREKCMRSECKEAGENLRIYLMQIIKKDSSLHDTICSSDCNYKYTSHSFSWNDCQCGCGKASYCINKAYGACAECKSADITCKCEKCSCSYCTPCDSTKCSSCSH